MIPTTLKTFLHPQKVYKLEYPGHWDNLQQDEGRSCGFGPHDRDDVGLWISIMPMSVDTDRLADELPKLMEQSFLDGKATNMRRDETLRHHAFKADIVKEGEGGHYWIVAGGDVVLFASTQVPVAERDEWNPAFEKLMASLQITRDEELLWRKVAGEVLKQLREKDPDQEFEFDEKDHICGKNQRISLTNVFCEVKESPKRRDKIIKNFVAGLCQSHQWPMGQEVWEEIRGFIVPVLKPRAYIVSDSPTQHLLIREWLADVIVVYAIKSKKFFRFVTGWDVRRWETTDDVVHELALENLAKLNWPKRIPGSVERDGGRVMIVDCDDSLASSRLLHGELHHLFSGPLGSPFWAGIPDRNTLVLFSDRRGLKKRIFRQLKKDNRKSAYPITARPFLVTADGIAPGDDTQ